ncbi:MAG: hypothetical protein AAGD06_22110 [Acidobacteriota bacterium]
MPAASAPAPVPARRNRWPAAPLAWPLTLYARRWVRRQIRIHGPGAEALDSDDRRALSPFFRPETLGALRLRVVGSIEGPPLGDVLRRFGLSPGLDFAQAAGITFDRLVLVSRVGRDRQVDDWRSLLFHELVHVVQYRLLGVDAFLSRYVGGWFDHGFDYYRIPLEEQAYRLEARFQGQAPGFSVEDTVRRELFPGADPGAR